jgi:hypothetical protein
MAKITWTKRGGATFDDDDGNRCRVWNDGAGLRITCDEGLITIRDQSLARELAAILISYAQAVDRGVAREWPHGRGRR